MVEQNIFDPSLPSLGQVLDRLVDASFGGMAVGAYENEVKRAVEAVVAERIQWLADNAEMPQVRAIATSTLRGIHGDLVAMTDAPHAQLLAMDIQRFLERPASPTSMPGFPSAPPGAPIGQPALDWLGSVGIGEPAMKWLRHTDVHCTWEDQGWH
ncbi:MAG: hypothetical protein HKO77_04745 [Gemmatimonadetes bacterium]|nr:hypothetical protein [Gemmatimonadota bacterium]